MSLYGELHNYVLAAIFVLLAVRARDHEFKIRACELCGQKDEHLPGCPGRR